MISAAIILVLLLALTLSVWNLIRSGRAGINNVCDLKAQEQEIDIDALALLLSPEENAYLRKALPGREFRCVKRKRLTLARKYLSAINRNTGQLIRTAEIARSGNDRELVQAANELLMMAFRVRLNVPLAHLYLLTEWLFPTLALAAPMKIKMHREMMEKVNFIVRNTHVAQARMSSAT